MFSSASSICSSKIICIFFINVPSCPFLGFQKLQTCALKSNLTWIDGIFQQLPSSRQEDLPARLINRSHHRFHERKPSSPLCVTWARWALMDHTHGDSQSETLSAPNPEQLRSKVTKIRGDHWSSPELWRENKHRKFPTQPPAEQANTHFSGRIYECMCWFLLLQHHHV